MQRMRFLIRGSQLLSLEWSKHLIDLYYSTKGVTDVNGSY